MKQVKNVFWKSIDFVYKHKLISFFVAIGLATSLILFNVFANDDEFANKLEVKNATITAIADGAVFNPDTTDGNGKDSSPVNGLLRNFDSITYRASYNLELKEADPEVTQVEGRRLIVDVILPNTIKASLHSDHDASDGSTLPVALDSNYDYYEYVMDGISTTTSEPAIFEFALWNVNTSVPDSSFTPIILIKEATDENYKAISEMTDNEKEALISNIPGNTIACNSNTLHCQTTMTGYYDFDVYLYQGVYNSSSNTETNKNYPIGLSVEASRSLGVYIPSSISFDVGITTEDPNLTVTYVDNSITNYKDTSKNYTVYFSEGLGELPNINNVVTLNNNTVSVGNLSINDVIVESLGVRTVMGTAAFEINSVRNNSSNNDNSNIKISLSNLKVGNTVIKQNGNELIVTDYASKIVGAFDSTIDILSSQDTYEEQGNAFLNYNQRFVIEEKINYAINGVGDALDVMHNYLKIDSDAFIIDKENVVKPDEAVVRFGYGKWTSEYFELNNVSGCPTNIAQLTKEQLMNLYGGPCLKEKANKVKWNVDDSTDPIIIIDTVFGEQGDETINFNPGTSETIQIAAKVRNDVALSETSHQITSLSNGLFNGTTYYMPKTANTNDINSAKNPNNYVKTVYNFETRNITYNTNTCNNYTCNISGDTAHILPFKVNKPSVKSYYNDTEKTQFYDYPIEWRINANVDSADDSIIFDGAIVAVSVPKSLKYLYAEILRGEDRVRIEPYRVETGTDADLYYYEFPETDIVNGAANTLSVFTDIYMNTKTGTGVIVTAIADFAGYKINSDNVIRLIDNRPNIYKLNYLEAVLYNDASITTSGDAAPRNIEKEKPYTYTMRSYNNSSLGAGTNTGYAYSGATLYYMLPYIEDSNYKIYDKKFTNSTYKIKLTENLPAGYTAYYTTDASKNIIGDIYNATNPDTTTRWTRWENTTTEVTATAIKIVKNNAWDIDTYFYSESGINAVVTPVKNAQADAYYNGFLMTVDNPSSHIDCDPNDPDCDDYYSSKLFYQSSKSLVEVYSRQISGFVFEDFNYSDMYENGEDQLKDVIVELYKLNNSEYNETSDSTNPNQYIDPSQDELIATKTTTSTGAYSFTGLEPGYYYVLFTYDGDKYTPSEKYGGIASGVPGADEINSKAIGRNSVPNEAVSDILTLSSSQSSNSKYINLGLRIRKEFGVEINKYITKVEVMSSQGNRVFEYDKATKVNIDIKNMKNTKFRVTYSFDIVNTKYFPGYIGLVMDLMPAGATFDNTIEGNGDWAMYDGILYYTGIQNTLLLPGEKHYFNLVLDIDTNTGGTYINIVAADQPALMGDNYVPVDPNSISVDVIDNGTGDNSGDNNAAGGTDDGNAAGGTDNHDSIGLGVGDGD